MDTIKKYSNRRLYDTSVSEYITQEELAEKIRSGTDVRVVHAKTDEDITQEVLAQIILESRGAANLLPVPLLMRLIRMGDDHLAEFFGQFMSWALELYLQFKEGAETMNPYASFGNAMGGGTGNGMFAGPEAFFRMLSGQPPWQSGAPWGNQGASDAPSEGAPTIEAGEPPPPEEEATPAAEVEGAASNEDPDVEELREEIDELKSMIADMTEESPETDES